MSKVQNRRWVVMKGVCCLQAWNNWDKYPWKNSWDPEIFCHSCAGETNTFISLFNVLFEIMCSFSVRTPVYWPQIFKTLVVAHSWKSMTKSKDAFSPDDTSCCFESVFVHAAYRVGYRLKIVLVARNVRFNSF